MTALDYDLAEKPTAAEKNFGPAPHRDQVATDGQTVTLGDESIKLFITAGHTPASLSMLIPVKDKGQSHTLLYLAVSPTRASSPTCMRLTTAGPAGC